MNAAPKIHEGHNVKRIREIPGIRQDALAIDLGLTPDKVAKALGITADAIKNFNEDAAFNIISNTYPRPFFIGQLPA